MTTNAMWAAMQSRHNSFIQETIDDLWPHLNASEAIHKRLSMEVGNECAICYEELSIAERPLKTTQCNHSFHGDCLGLWILRHGSCPICRANISVANTVNTSTATLRSLVRKLRRNRWSWIYDSNSIFQQLIGAFHREPPSGPYSELFVDGATRVELLIDFETTSRNFNDYYEDLYKVEMPPSSPIKRDLEMIANEWTLILSRFPERRHQLMVAMDRGGGIADARGDRGAADHYRAQVRRICLHDR